MVWCRIRYLIKPHAFKMAPAVRRTICHHFDCFTNIALNLFMWLDFVTEAKRLEEKTYWIHRTEPFCQSLVFGTRSTHHQLVTRHDDKMGISILKASSFQRVLRRLRGIFHSKDKIRLYKI